MVDEGICAAAIHEGWPGDEMERIEKALTPLSIQLKHHGDSVAVVGTVDQGSSVRVDYSQRQPVRLAVWKLIEKERQLAAAQGRERDRQADASRRLKAQRKQFKPPYRPPGLE